MFTCQDGKGGELSNQALEMSYSPSSEVKILYSPLEIILKCNTLQRRQTPSQPFLVS